MKNKLIKIAKQRAYFAGEMACFCMYDDEARSRNKASLWYEERGRIMDALTMFELVDHKIAYKIVDDQFELGFQNERSKYN